MSEELYYRLVVYKNVKKQYVNKFSSAELTNTNLKPLKYIKICEQHEKLCLHSTTYCFSMSKL